MAFGVTLALIDVGKATIVPALGFPAPSPRYGYGESLIGAGAGALWGALLGAVEPSVGPDVRHRGRPSRLRLRWLSLVVTALFLSLMATSDMSPALLSIGFALASGALLTVVAVRFGLLSLVVTWFTWGLIAAVPMTLEFSHWRADASNWTLALLIGMTLFGFYASRAGQPLFGSILDER